MKYYAKTLRSIPDVMSYVQELKAVIGKQWEEAGDLTVYVAYFRADAGQRATAYINTIKKLSK